MSKQGQSRLDTVQARRQLGDFVRAGNIHLPPEERAQSLWKDFRTRKMDVKSIPSFFGEIISLFSDQIEEQMAQAFEFLDAAHAYLDANEDKLKELMKDIDLVNGKTAQLGEKVEAMKRYKEFCQSMRHFLLLDKVKGFETLTTRTLAMLEVPKDVMDDLEAAKGDMVLQAPSLSMGKKVASDHLNDLNRKLAIGINDNCLPDIDKTTGKADENPDPTKKDPNSNRSLIADYAHSYAACKAEGREDLVNEFHDFLSQAGKMVAKLGMYESEEANERLAKLNDIPIKAEVIIQSWGSGDAGGMVNQIANMDRLINLFIWAHRINRLDKKSITKLCGKCVDPVSRTECGKKLKEAGFEDWVDKNYVAKGALDIQSHPLTLSWGRIIEMTAAIAKSHDGIALIKMKSQTVKVYLIALNYMLQKRANEPTAVVSWIRPTKPGESPTRKPGYINSACHEFHRLLTGQESLCQNTSSVKGNCALVIITQKKKIEVGMFSDSKPQDPPGTSKGSFLGQRNLTDFFGMPGLEGDEKDESQNQDNENSFYQRVDHELKKRLVEFAASDISLKTLRNKQTDPAQNVIDSLKPIVYEKLKNDVANPLFSRVVKELQEEGTISPGVAKVFLAILNLTPGSSPSAASTPRKNK